MRYELLVRLGLGLMVLVSLTRVSGGEAGSSAAPFQAAAVGYTTRTFSSTFRTSQVDIANTLATGFKWYPYQFFGGVTKLSKIRLNADGSVTLLGDNTGPNGELATVSPTTQPDRFIGTAFGGGGYFEATLKFDPQDVIRTKFKGWPSWWSMALEHMVALDGQQWPGQQEGYDHFIEADFFEYDLAEYVEGGKLNYFGGALHDWFGRSGEQYSQAELPSRAFVREVPADTDFAQYHRYGFLWVPATATRDGYAEHYFDGMRVGRRVSWRQYVDQAPPPRQPRIFSVMDRNHLVLILGTGPGQAMTVQSVNVWQISDAGNMKR
jgi:hypothetical protein